MPAVTHASATTVPSTTRSRPRGSGARLAPPGLERRLLASYLIAFAVALLVFGLAVRVVYVASLEAQAASRLDVLARGGLSSVFFVSNGFEVREEIPTVALTSQERGLEWFDRDGRRLLSEGIVPETAVARVGERERLAAGRMTLETVTLPVVNPKTHQTLGAVRASESDEQIKNDVRELDLSLLVGSILALAASGVGGSLLARQAVRPIEASVRTLRDFTADASHELRGPLTAIATNAEAALRAPERDPERDRARFAMIAQKSREMGRLADDLLLLARADRSLEHELFAVSLVDVVQKLGGLYAAQFKAKGVALDVRATTDAQIYGNPDQIERILGNLIENALRYTPSEGRVSIEVRRDRSQVGVVVRDTGIGIAPEHLDRVFDRFWRADNARSAAKGGTGLGLAIARTLARRHGGDITVTSRLGAGSAFVATFPLRPPRTS